MSIVKNNRAVLAQYAFLLLCLATVFFFVIPQSDVFLFARYSGKSVPEIIDYSLNYGNGRLLGNIIGVFFSHHFAYAWILVAVTLTLIIVLLNGIFFGHSKYMVFPLAILTVFPSAGIFGECYAWFAAFTNFCLPILFVLLAIYIYIYIYMKKKCEKRLFFAILMCLFAASVCLFSENTTVVSCVIAFFVLLYAAFTKKKRFLGVLYFVATLLGAGIMLLIPVVTGTAYKMDGYRKLETGLKEIIVNAIASYARFSEIITSFTVLIVLLSLVLLACLNKQSKRGRFDGVCATVIGVYPIYSLLIRNYGYQAWYLAISHLGEMVATAIYFFALVYVLSRIENKMVRLNALIGCVVVLSSILPMLLVNQYGYRTYLTTYFALLSLSLYLLNYAVNLTAFSDKLKLLSKHAGAVMSGMVFIFVCGFIFVQMMYNYNVYSVRTEYVAERLATDNEQIEIPFLPFRALTVEERWPNVIGHLSGDTKGRLKIMDLASCENSNDYYEVLGNSIFTNLKRAIDNLEFKDPLYVEKRIGNVTR